MATKLTVFFEDPFWVGVFEKNENGMLRVCKVTFGAEPKDAEVLAFVEKHFADLPFSPAVSAEERPAPDNPKRRQRSAAKQISARGVGTKAQQALQRQREEKKTERKQLRRAARDEEKERQFLLRQQKKKEKHRGR